MTIATRPDALPLSEAARIDTELQEKIHRLATGTARSEDAGAISRLIRERAEMMVPEILRESARAGEALIARSRAMNQ
jgi:hypothetical protein